MKNWLGRWGWTVAKIVLGGAILVAVGWRFHQDLQRPEIANLTFRPGWLVLSGFLYITFLGFAAGFWYRLLATFGKRPSVLATGRAYYISQLGKYLPGKAWSLLLRATAMRHTGVRFGVALMSALYEVLTVMASGSLLAAILFFWQPPDVPGMSWHPVWAGLGLLVLCGIFLWPAVFNFLAGRLIRRIHQDQNLMVPRLSYRTLAEGLFITGCGWFVFGISLWAVMQSILPDPPPLTVERLLLYVASLGLAYVAGFLVLVVPGGIGVREFFLLNLLRSEGPEALVAAAVLATRLVWTAAELVMAAAVYGLPAKPQTPLPSPPERSQ